MAKSSNTWCKKLMHKAKVHALKHKLGNEEGLLERSGGESYHNKMILDDRRAQLAKYKFGVVDGDMPDKPGPKPVPTMAQVKSHGPSRWTSGCTPNGMAKMPGASSCARPART